MGNNSIPIIYSYGNGSIFYSYSDEGFKFIINPYIGKKLSRNWITGLRLVYSFGESSGNSYSPSGINEFDRILNGYILGIFGRYILNPENPFNFFIELSIRFSTTNQTDAFVDNNIEEIEYNIKPYYIWVTFGASNNINNKVSLLANIGNVRYENRTFVRGDNSDKVGNIYSAYFRLSNIAFGAELLF